MFLADLLGLIKSNHILCMLVVPGEQTRFRRRHKQVFIKMSVPQANIKVTHANILHNFSVWHGITLWWTVLSLSCTILPPSEVWLVSVLCTSSEVGKWRCRDAYHDRNILEGMCQTNQEGFFRALLWWRRVACSVAILSSNSIYILHGMIQKRRRSTKKEKSWMKGEERAWPCSETAVMPIFILTVPWSKKINSHHVILVVRSKKT